MSHLTDPHHAPDSTVAGVEMASRPGTVWVRRGATALLVLLVLAALAGRLGVRTEERVAERDGYRLALRYPAAARAGLDTPWRVTVEHAGGFGKELTLAVSGDYLGLFETQGFHPEPSESTRDATTLYLTFTAPEGDTFVVDYDAYIQPSSQLGASARVSLVDGTEPVVWVDYRTRLLP